MIKKIAIVTGAGTGIGRAVACRLASEGIYPVLVYATSETGARQTAGMIQEAGYDAMVIKADISQEDAVNDLFDTVMRKFKRLDIVINNAGVGSMGLMADIPTAEFDRIFNTNCRGTFFMCRQAARHIADNGRIINLSTGLTVSSQACMGLYTASKAAVESFTRTLAHELGPRGITVNTLSPGMTNTPMLDGGNTEKLKQAGAQQSVMKRLGQPDDIADSIAMLVSHDGRWLTGQNIHADGGSVLT